MPEFRLRQLLVVALSQVHEVGMELVLASCLSEGLIRVDVAEDPQLEGGCESMCMNLWQQVGCHLNQCLTIGVRSKQPVPAAFCTR